MQISYINRKYSVDFDSYTKGHYEKYFTKKYKGNWIATKESIKDSLERIYNLKDLNVLDCICCSNKNTVLLKFDFSIAKSKISPKKSGNRCILEVCNKSCCVKIILIYCKKHIDRPDGQETLWWKEKIKERFQLHCSA